jgi:hypothetical protein
MVSFLQAECDLGVKLTLLRVYFVEVTCQCFVFQLRFLEK